MTQTAVSKQVVIEHLDGNRRGEIVRFVQDILIIGRGEDCDLMFSGEQSTSTHHAQIRQRDGQIELVDTESVSGTYLNEARVSRAQLNEGDVLRFGVLGPMIKVSFLDALSADVPGVVVAVDAASVATENLADSGRSFRFIRNAAVLYLGGAVASVQGWNIVVDRYSLKVHWFSVFLVWLCGGFVSTMLEAWYRGAPGAQRIVWWEVAVHASVLAICSALTWAFVANAL
jgi:FHA domain